MYKNAIYHYKRRSAQTPSTGTTGSHGTGNTHRPPTPTAPHTGTTRHSTGGATRTRTTPGTPLGTTLAHSTTHWHTRQHTGTLDPGTLYNTTGTGTLANKSTRGHWTTLGDTSTLHNSDYSDNRVTHLRKPPSDASDTHETSRCWLSRRDTVTFTSMHM